VRGGLTAAAAVLVFVLGALVVRAIAALAASPPVAAPQEGDESRFAARLLASPAPIVALALIGIAVLVNSASFEEAIVGLLMTSAAMAIVLQVLCSELLLWSHHPVRMTGDRERRIIERLRRSGAMVNEVWVSPTPIVVFWRLSLVTPAVVSRSRLLLWDSAERLPSDDAGGLALAAPASRFWPWALAPFAAAIGLRVRDPLSLIPWWLFAAVGGLIALTAVPDLLHEFRIERALRTDAGTRDAIRGALEFGREEARLCMGRGDGVMARWSAASAWARAHAIARRAARRSGLPMAVVDASAAAVLSAPATDVRR